MDKNKRNIVYISLLVFGLGVTYFMANSVVPNVLITLTRAAPSKKISLENSYVLGAKILAKADGVDKGLINIFIMDNDGKGISGKTVLLKGDPENSNLSAVSDSDGRASFEIVSTKVGQFEVKAEVGGVELPRGVKVTFRNWDKRLFFDIVSGLMIIIIGSEGTRVMDGLI